MSVWNYVTVEMHGHTNNRDTLSSAAAVKISRILTRLCSRLVYLQHGGLL